MPDQQPSTTITCSGFATVRQRPALLLMKLRLRASEPTLELGLARLKKQANATSQWLKRLGAERVDHGEPHFADQADMDPIVKMRAATMKAFGKRTAEAAAKGPERGVCLVLTASWPIAQMSAEETLVLVDRLRFEVAEDAGEPETPEAVEPWTSPEEQLQAMMSQFQQTPTVDDSPQFLFITRLGEEQREAAAAEAFSRACQNGQRLARAAYLRLGPIQSLISVQGPADVSRPDKLMDRQRCLGMLAGSSYELAEHEIVSDDPRVAEFCVTVNTIFCAEPGTQKGS